MKKERKKSTFWADFKAFISKGSVLQMAVGVVIGGAFGKITSGLVNFIITPLIGLFTGGLDLTEALVTKIWKGQYLLNDAGDKVLDAAGEPVKVYVKLQWGAWLQTILDFLIIALCMFIILRVVTKMQALAHAKQTAEAEAAAAKKAEEDKAAAEAAAAEAAEKAAAEKAVQDQFYANVREQTELLRQIRESVKK